MMLPKQLTGKVDDHLTAVIIGEKAFWVHPQVSHDLLALKQAAKQAGFDLNIASGFRSFARQKNIWDRKMTGKSAVLDDHNRPLTISTYSEKEKILAILRWSALPGASRHHWGTDFDVFDRRALPENGLLHLEPWEYLQDHQAPFYTWLKAHLNDFGFFFPYQGQHTGVAFEPWHISHSHTAEYCLTSLTLEALHAELINERFEGQETVLQNLEMIYNHYIINIAKAN
ncbi:D-alanyl-D-alanine carboxypeptidase family protein [Vibrio sp. V27_P1S3P104]|nr:D-alanyl-D-alanine carboxypeptidase family protein [Vibrio sp. V28_P6S34P95]NAX06502.1 D-alanyl-D-alanine carboxypeptidase family protein [Vibrio sp. V30_P3S12P165]NAX33401.1 D-alanyl-D-alanine carboxypeptidase family protein [Vibrio sp. V29_P1S30P107]NAX38590.1 D-alanyl-D-alanine carboxypeptidase family protein [Vibrio sp. V27_P1S3P104]NAX41467.1 D-alanyl-D-alanine carboxypeptidase family protein [Vibrio sp. V26_P1S5P106]NNN43219.1 M15 family metallopeptidase [Vibrio sp. 1-1(7)]NNN71043.1